MIEIKPFKAYRYNEQKIKNLNNLFTPPYDVITQKEQDAFYKLSKYNFIRLILPKEYPGDNRYKRARDILNKWIKKSVMVKEETAAIYLYEQSYKIDGILKKRIGFIGLVRLRDFSDNLIFPHEKTFAGPKKDRSLILKELKANLSPIFSLFNDPQKKITSILKEYAKNNRRILKVKDKDAVSHSLWQIQDPKLINKIVSLMYAKDIFIADGHHRYEAALGHKKSMEAKSRYSKDAPYNFVMTYFLGLDEDAVTILPTHRVIKLKEELKKNQILEFLKQSFFVKRKKSLKTLVGELKTHQRKNHCFGLCLGRGGYFILIPKDKANIKRRMKDAHHHLKKLDVNILHSLIIDDIAKEKDVIREISYIRDLGHIQELMNKDNNFIAFLLNPMKISQFKKVVKDKIRLPHKSTYFYPKPLSGLLLHRFDA